MPSERFQRNKFNDIKKSYKWLPKWIACAVQKILIFKKKSRKSAVVKRKEELKMVFIF